MARWAYKEEEFLEKNVLNYTEKELAKILNRSVKAVKSKKTRLGIKAGQRIVDGKAIKQKEWTDEDDKIVVAWYESHENDLMLDKLAEKLDRTPEFVCRQANRLGLTRFGRKPSWFIEEITNNLNKWNGSEEGKRQREINLEKMKQIVKTKHPKGMKGKTHSEEYKKAISIRVKKYWANITPGELERQIDKQIETRKRNGTLNPMKSQTNPYSRARGGKRVDLNNQYFRSSWEANIARCLNYMNIEWIFEPREFIFSNEKRGSISYTPDFYLPELDKWIEVKGWMDSKSKNKLTRFKEYFPEEFEKLEIIGSDEYNGIKKNAHLIPNWEA